MALPLFTYGTLMYPDIIGPLLNRVPPARPGSVTGYRRLGVSGHDFPGLIPGGNDTVEGLVYDGLTMEEWERLTEYEGDFYILQETTVTCGSTAEAALVYLVRPGEQILLTDKPWVPDPSRMGGG